MWFETVSINLKYLLLWFQRCLILNDLFQDELLAILIEFLRVSLWTNLGLLFLLACWGINSMLSSCHSNQSQIYFHSEHCKIQDSLIFWMMTVSSKINQPFLRKGLDPTSPQATAMCLLTCRILARGVSMQTQGANNFYNSLSSYYLLVASWLQIVAKITFQELSWKDYSFAYMWSILQISGGSKIINDCKIEKWVTWMLITAT